MKPEVNTSKAEYVQNTTQVGVHVLWELVILGCLVAGLGRAGDDACCGSCFVPVPGPLVLGCCFVNAKGGGSDQGLELERIIGVLV